MIMEWLISIGTFIIMKKKDNYNKKHLNNDYIMKYLYSIHWPQRSKNGKKFNRRWNESLPFIFHNSGNFND